MVVTMTNIRLGMAEMVAIVIFAIMANLRPGWADRWQFRAMGSKFFASVDDHLPAIVDGTTFLPHAGS